MKKLLLLILTVWVSSSAVAAHLPDNMYFRAMKDEMDRTLKELRLENSAAPYYVAYKLTREHNYSTKASFGALFPKGKEEEHLDGLVMVSVGSPQKDGLGFGESNEYRPITISSAPKNYEGLRNWLWVATDMGYKSAISRYEAKQAYKRQKNLADDRPDFTRAPQATYVEDIPEFKTPDRKKMDELAKRLSAWGKELPFLDSFRVSFNIGQEDYYYLNSDGSFYQYARPNSHMTLRANFRNEQGYQEMEFHSVTLPASGELDEKKLEQETKTFLATLEPRYKAKKAEAYLGPVLFKGRGAALFWGVALEGQVKNITPLFSAQDFQDYSAGAFRNKMGMRVMSPGIEVYDRPLERSYKGEPLAGFMPVDDEGVKPQELLLISGGRLRALPRTRRPAEKDAKSNGHARMSRYSYPREGVTNLFIEVKNPVSEQELEKKLLTRCRELELEYCYILRDVDRQAERIYTQDGRREEVFGADVSLTERALRDILAAGRDRKAYSFNNVSFITPSMLVDEVEIEPLEKNADRPSFVEKPVLK